MESINKILNRMFSIVKSVLSEAYNRLLVPAFSFMGTQLSFLNRQAMKTSLGQWANKYAAEKAEFWRRAWITYKALKSPVMDPLVAQMLVKNEEIDVSDDDVVVKGNTLFLLIGSFFIIAILWATFTELDEVVRAEGVVVPPSSIQTVQSMLPGSVTQIRVELGDRVEAGDVLFQIEDRDMLANFDDNEISRITSEASAARLRAEAEGASSVSFPEHLITLRPDAVARETELFEQRQAALKDKLKLSERKISEFEAQINISKSSSESVNEEIKILEPLVEGGHESKLYLLQRKADLARLEGELKIARLSAERARDQYESIVSEYRANAAQELASVRTIAEQAGAKEDALKGRVEQASIRSPVAGVVSAVFIKTVGGAVQQGTAMAEIVPDEKALLIRARIPVEDISSIFVNQPANVALSSYDPARYGSLKGTVSRIASNSTSEERMPPYYETMIEIPDPRFSKSAEEVEVVPGMTATVDIIGKKRTVLNYILTPIERASGVVFREK